MKSLKTENSPSNFQRYVVGFLFKNDNSEVALIEKLKPDWQRNKLNGIGGKIEVGESPYDAMVREFKEETGAEVKDWKGFLALRYENAEVFFFHSKAPVEIKSIEDEAVGWYFTDKVVKYSELIPNLRWILPLAVAEDEPLIGTIIK